MGGWGKIEIIDQLSPAEAEVRAELGNRNYCVPASRGLKVPGNLAVKVYLKEVIDLVCRAGYVDTLQ